MKKIKLIAAGLAASTMVLASCGNDHVHTYSDQWTSNETQHWHAATCGHDVCDGLANHHDDVKDHKCDDCGYVMSTCVDNNNDHKCDICGKDLPYVSSVTISGAPEEMARGTSVTLKANVQTHSGASNSVTWSVNDASLASISAGGVLTAKANGTVTVTATSTVDSSKKDSVNITIIDPDWSDDDKEMMLYYFEEAVPYFSGSFEWTDEYYEDYACLSAESSNASDAAKAAADLEKIAEGEFEDGEGYFILDCVEDSNYYFYFDVYEDYYGGACVDVYQFPQEYEEWPTELIASQIAELEVGEVVLPGITFSDGYVTSELFFDETYGLAFMNTSVYTDGEADGEAYALVLNGAGFVVDYDADYEMYQAHDANKKITVVFWDEVDEESGDNTLTIQTTEYIPDVYFELNTGDLMLAVNDTFVVEAINEGGEDMPAEPNYVFSSYDKTVASIDESGLVTALKSGVTAIIVDLVDNNGKVLGEQFAYLYVEESVKTEWSAEDLKAFHDVDNVDGLELPFNAFFDKVTAGDRSVTLESTYYTSTLLGEYITAMEADGWTCELDVFAAMFGIEYYICSKEVEIGGVTYMLSAEACCVDEEGYISNEGFLTVEMYDENFYSWEDALAPLKEWAKDSNFKSFDGILPEVASNSYTSAYNEDYGWYEILMDTAADDKAYSAALAGAGFVLDETYNYYYLDADGEAAIEVYPNLDGTFGIYIYDTRANSSELVFADYFDADTDLTEDYLETDDGFELEFSLAKGQSAPKFYASSGDARLYANNTMVISAPAGKTITSIAFTATSQKGGTISADVGTFANNVWTGEADEITFTVSASGQYRVTEMEITYGGLPTPSPSAVIDEFPSEQLAEFLGDKITDTVLVAVGTKFAYQADEESALVAVAGSGTDYITALMINGYHVDVSMYEEYLEYYEVGFATAYSPNGQIFMEIYDFDNGTFQMEIYPAEVQKFPAEAIATALGKLVSGTTTVLPEFFSSAYQVREGEGYVDIYGDPTYGVEQVYASVLDDAGWIVSSMGGGAYLATSPTRDIKIMFGLVQDSQTGASNFLIEAVGAEPMLPAFPADAITSEIHLIDDDAAIIPVVDSADVLGYYYKASTATTYSTIQVAITKGQASTVGEAYVGQLIALGYETVSMTSAGVIIAKPGETVQYSLSIVDAGTIAITIMDAPAE